MNKIFEWIMLILLLMGAACGPDKAAQLLETAQFEERQNNRTHARELYEEILRKYPDSPAAPTARARLTQLTDNP